MFVANITAPAGFKPAGQALSIYLAGYKLSCTLDAKGRYKAGSTLVSLRLAKGILRFTVRVSRQDLQSQIKAAVNANIKATVLTDQTFLVNLGGKYYAARLAPTYTASKDRRGLLAAPLNRRLK